LLSPDEQRTLAAVSIFQHTFDRQATAAVSACDLATILGLVNRSLVRINAPGRYTLHPLLKSFAAEQRGPNAAVEESFYRYVLGQLHPDAHGGKQLLYDSRLDGLQGLQAADVANAWKLAAAHGDNEILARALPHFAFFWRAIGRQHEGIRLLEDWRSAIVANPLLSSGQRLWLGQIHHQIALAYQSIHEHAEALQHGELALSYLQESDKRESLGWLLADLGGFYLNTDQSAQAAEHLECALAMGERINAKNLQIEAAWKLTAVYWARGDYPRADALYRHTLSVAPSLDSLEPERTKLFIELFNQAAFRQDWRQAERILKWLDAWCSEHAALPEVLTQKRALMIILLSAQERWEEAYQSARALVDEAASSSDPSFYCSTLKLAAWPAFQAESKEVALNLLQEAERAASHAGLTSELTEIQLTTGIVLFRSGAVDEAARYFVSTAKHALSKPSELYSLRRLIAVIFYLAQIKRPNLSPDLFQKAVITAAAQPQTGFLTRNAAQQLAAAEGIAPANWSGHSQRPVEWSDLELLIESILPWVDPQLAPSTMLE
jgi:tetratricopeptide (TPR) repeat protein